MNRMGNYTFDRMVDDAGSLASASVRLDGSYFIQYHAPMQACLPARDSLGKRVHVIRFQTLLDYEQFIQRQQLLSGFQTTPHPSIMRTIAQISDPRSPAKVASVIEFFQENMRDFIARRRKINAYLTHWELVFLTRQLIAGLAVWHSVHVVHGRIGLTNTMWTRNGQNQLVFKIGDLGQLDEGMHHKAIEVLEGKNPDFSADIFSLGIVLCEAASLQFICASTTAQLQAEIAQLLDSLKSGELHGRYGAVQELINALCQMIELDATKRPTPKTVQLALAAVDIGGVLHHSCAFVDIAVQSSRQ